MTKIHIHPIKPSKNKPVVPKPSEFVNKEALEKELRKRGLRIELGSALKGGTVSQVYEALLIENNKKLHVVVKHTEGVIPFDPTELLIRKEGHNTDTQILQSLKDLGFSHVPKVLYSFPDITTTIMDDVRTTGYKLYVDYILQGNIRLDSSAQIGTEIANLEIALAKIPKIKPNESAEESFYERGLELRLAYPNTQEEFKELENAFVQNNKYLTAPDVHPKNILINNAGQPIFIDFGRVCYGDQRFVLPTFLAHVVSFGLAGYYPLKQTVEYVKSATTVYKQIISKHSRSFDEQIFSKYLGAEVLHRSMGKWIVGINTATQKSTLVKFGLMIFDNKISTLQELNKLILEFT